MKSSENNKFKFFNSNPIKSLAGIYIYLIVVIVIIGLIYVDNLNDITSQNVPPRLNTHTVKTDLKLQEAKVIPPVDVMTLMEPSADIIAKGKKLFLQSCASCHGNTGKGDGTAGVALTPKPRNFTKNTGWINGRKLSDIYKTLEEGIPGSGMASYSYLLPEEKLALGSFIRADFVSNSPKETEDDLLNLDLNYNLSDGAKIPAQIPVKFAAKIIISEKKATVQKIEKILSSLKNMNDNEGRKLFYKITNNQFSALVTLNSNLNWKKDEKLFIDTIVNDVVNNGFNGKVFQLSSKQWGSLFLFLNKQIH